MKYLTLLVVAMSLLAGCVSDAPPKRKPQIVQPNNPYSGQGNNVTFEGTIVEVKSSPEAWSGIFSFFQGVEYRITRVVDGELAGGGTIVVYHKLDPSTLTEKDRPELSHQIFKAGNKLRVVAEKTRDNDYVELYGPSRVTLLESK